SDSSVSGENRLKSGAMNLGAAQVKPKVQTNQIAQAHTHHPAPACSMRVSVARSNGPPSNTMSSNCLAKSTAYSRGGTRLNPKRASTLNVLHSEKGKPTSCSSSNTVATTHAPRHGSSIPVWRQTASTAARPPPKVSASLTSASPTVAH